MVAALLVVGMLYQRQQAEMKRFAEQGRTMWCGCILSWVSTTSAPWAQPRWPRPPAGLPIWTNCSCATASWYRASTCSRTTATPICFHSKAWYQQQIGKLVS
jgi:hypothetical protein